MNDAPKKRGRPKKESEIKIFPHPTTHRVLVDIPKIEISGYALYKKLADSGFPQGGGGSIVLNEEGNDTAYVPRPEELYNSFLADPEGWKTLTDALARAWIEQHGSKSN